MVIYSTLKANKEHGIRNIDIISYYEECYGCTGELFGEEYWTWDKWETDKETNDEKLFNDFTERQIASACLKELKKLAKDKEEPLMIWNKIFFAIDLPEYCYDLCITLIENGEITCRRDLREIEKNASKKGVTIKKEVCYDEANRYYTMSYIDDIIDEYYPCNYDINEECTNCGNCQ